MKNLLVIDYNTSIDWSTLFKGITIKNEPLLVQQCGWQDITLLASSTKGVRLLLKKAEEPVNKLQKEDREFSPDFLLVRNFPQGLHNNHYKNILLGFMFANIPSVNSLQSIFMCAEKPIVYGQLQAIKKKLKDFPVIEQMYVPNIPSCQPVTLIENTWYPVIAKVATIHSGYGKMKLDTAAQLEDFQSCMVLNNDYYTLEPFVGKCIYDFRLQKIGNHIRVYTRGSSSGWRNNWGDLKFESVQDIPERFKLWIDEVAKLFGGIDMFALDVMHTDKGTDHIIELNDTAMGLMFEHEKEDQLHIRDLVVEKMNAIF